MMRGLIIQAKSGFYTVKTDEGYYLCHLRGRLKRGPRLGDIAAIGDWVKFTPLKEAPAQTMNDFPLKGKGIIEEIEERQRMLSRLAPTPKGEYQQSLLPIRIKWSWFLPVLSQPLVSE
jgi:ribosome biogenesis GTPase